MFLSAVREEDARGPVAEMYRADRERWGYLPNFARVFSSRPEAYAGWRTLLKAIAGPMDPRRYELVTVAAARQLGSTYCVMAHSKILMEDFDGPDVVERILSGRAPGGPDGLDVAVMDLAQKVAADAGSITEADFDRLRDHGLEDAEILDVVLAAAARCFFSKVLDAVGAAADAELAAYFAPGQQELLTVGRPAEPPG
ncbi:MAG: carboxymuconolactone decarboxylase family protein [Acidimicrobiia bacterium]